MHNALLQLDENIAAVFAKSSKDFGNLKKPDCIWSNLLLKHDTSQGMVYALPDRAAVFIGRQCSSAVEQRFRKPSVAGSIPAIGSSPYRLRGKGLGGWPAQWLTVLANSFG